MLIVYMGSNGPGQTNDVRNCKWLRVRLLWLRNSLTHSLGRYSGKISMSRLCPSLFIFVQLLHIVGEKILVSVGLWSQPVCCVPRLVNSISIFSIPCSRCNRPFQSSWFIFRSIHLPRMFNTWHHRTHYQGFLFWLQQKLSKPEMFLRKY